MIAPEDVKRFEDLQDLFSNPGWKVLADELEFKVEAIKEGFTQFGTLPELISYGQGRISVYREFLTLPDIINNALNEHANEQADPV